MKNRLRKTREWLGKKSGQVRDKILNKLGFTYYAELNVSVNDMSEIVHTDSVIRYVGKRKYVDGGFISSGFSVTLFAGGYSLDEVMLELADIEATYKSHSKAYYILITRVFRKIDHDPSIF